MALLCQNPDVVTCPWTCLGASICIHWFLLNGSICLFEVIVDDLYLQHGYLPHLAMMAVRYAISYGPSLYWNGEFPECSMIGATCEGYPNSPDPKETRDFSIIYRNHVDNICTYSEISHAKQPQNPYLCLFDSGTEGVKIRRAYCMWADMHDEPTLGSIVILRIGTYWEFMEFDRCSVVILRTRTYWEFMEFDKDNMPSPWLHHIINSTLCLEEVYAFNEHDPAQVVALELAFTWRDVSTSHRVCKTRSIGPLRLPIQSSPEKDQEWSCMGILKRRGKSRDDRGVYRDFEVGLPRYCSPEFKRQEDV
ncbi:hypothetical protein VNO77_44236 [Canavalia gladiata]|uniref:Uncharacterized protein n=1 Tax=Canavalia gladiata TaxID=3824 RepID=A0AAN9JWP4_CANGL